MADVKIAENLAIEDKFCPQKALLRLLNLQNSEKPRNSGKNSVARAVRHYCITVLKETKETRPSV